MKGQLPLTSSSVETLAKHGIAVEDDEETDALVASLEAEERLRPTLPRFRILRDEELHELGDPEPLVDSVLFRDTLAQITGASGSFKTFIALDLACCIAAGIPWCGHATRGGPVLYIVAEGAHGMRKRVAAWKEANGINRSLNIYFVTQSVVLNEPLDVEGLLAQLAEIEVQPVAIFIDTLARNFKGDESTAKDMSAYIHGCDRLRRECGGATVTSVHHTGWGDQERGRGSSSQPGALDTEIIIARDGNRVKLRCKKQKDAEEFGPFQLEMRPMGESLVPFWSKDPVGLLSANERKSLTILQSHFASDGATATEWQEVVGIPRSSFFAARSRLLEARYAQHAGARYRLTDSGRLLIESKSNGSPTGSGGGGLVSPAAPPLYKSGELGLNLERVLSPVEEAQAVKAYDLAERRGRVS